MAHRSALPAESDITGERDAGVDEALTPRAPGAGTTDRLAETTDGLSSVRVRRHMQTIGRYLAPPLTAVISSRLPIEATERASHRHQVDSNLLDQEHAGCRVSLQLSDSHGPVESSHSICRILTPVVRRSARRLGLRGGEQQASDPRQLVRDRPLCRGGSASERTPRSAHPRCDKSSEIRHRVAASSAAHGDRAAHLTDSPPAGASRSGPRETARPTGWPSSPPDAWRPPGPPLERRSALRGTGHPRCASPRVAWPLR